MMFCLLFMRTFAPYLFLVVNVSVFVVLKVFLVFIFYFLFYLFHRNLWTCATFWASLSRWWGKSFFEWCISVITALFSLFPVYIGFFSVCSCIIQFVDGLLYGLVWWVIFFFCYNGHRVVAYTEVRRREATPGGLPSAVSSDRLSSSKV